MPKEFETQRVSKTQVQSGIPMRARMASPASARGVIVRGVVTATYVSDDGAHPQTDNEPFAVYCDVLTYSTISGMQSRLIKYALVRQDRSSIHGGRIWKPRAATLDVNGNPMNLEKGTNPGSVDGDHVLVGFMDDSFNLPVILGAIPHPSADVGNESKDIGHRTRLTLADGDPDFWKHHGAFYGIDDAGDFIVDLTEAYVGPDLETDGKEKVPAEDGTTGNYKVKLPKASKLTIEIEGGANLELDLKDSDAKLTLGDGAKSAVIAEAFQTFWDTTVKPLFDAFDAHVHPTGVGPSGPPAPLVTFPTFDTAAISSKVKFPDG